MPPPAIKVSGIGSIPPGYVLGRQSPGVGDVELIAAPDIIRGGGLSSGGSSGSSTPATEARDAIVFDLGEAATVAAGTNLYHLRVPYRFHIINVKAELKTGTATGSVIVDLNYGGASFLSTKLTIEVGELTSMEAAVLPVWSPDILGDDGILTLDVDSAGDGTAVGLKVQIIGYFTTDNLTASGTAASLLSGVSQAALGGVPAAFGTIGSILGEVTQAAAGTVTVGGAATESYPGSLTLTNPGAETGDGTGWTLRSNSLPVAVAAPGSGSPHAGSWAFHGGNVSSSWWDQTVNIPSNYNTDIDNGWVKAVFKGWHAGFTTDTDKGGLVIEAYDGSSNRLAIVQNTHTDPAGATVWTQDTLEVYLPTGTRVLKVGTRNIRVTGTELSTYWDDFTLQLDATPQKVRNVWVGVAVATTGWTLASGGAMGVDATAAYGLDAGYTWASGPAESYRDFSLTTYATKIDAGTADIYLRSIKYRFNLGDNCRMYVKFFDGSSVQQGSTLFSEGSESTAPTGGQDITITGDIPATTRTVRIGMTGTATDGTAIQYPASLITLLIVGGV